MKFFEKNKTLVIALVLFAVAILVYNFFLQPTVNTIDQNSATATAGGDVVALNQRLQSATLDQSLFSTTAYRELVDFSTPIASQPIGRTNPFDILGQ